MENNVQTVCVIGSSGSIGGALVAALSERDSVQKVYALSRVLTPTDTAKVSHRQLDILDESSVRQAAAAIDEPLDLIVVATGQLHSADGLTPEKTYRSINPEHMTRILAINTVGPSMIAAHFIPKLRPRARTVFAALSARVGSINDNRLGGWYSYRASKAALNMVLKTLAIEVARHNRQAIVVGLHPGTVDSALSAPFQANVPPGKLFTPGRSARALLDVIDGLDANASGGVYDWAGERVPA